MKLTKEQTIEAVQLVIESMLVSLPERAIATGAEHREEIFDAIACVAMRIVEENSPMGIAEIPSNDLALAMRQSRNRATFDATEFITYAIDKHWKDPRSDMKSILYAARVQDLAGALLSIYDCLNCDEHNQYNPQESTAASSAADFVDAANYVFNQLLERKKSNG